MPESRGERTLYLFYGDDAIERAGVEADLKARAAAGDPSGMNTVVYQGETVDLATIINAALSLPFLAETRLVIVHDFFRALAGPARRRQMDTLMEEAATFPRTARLVLLEQVERDRRGRIPADHAVVQFAGRLQSMPGAFVRAIFTADDVARWAIDRAKAAYGAALDQRAADALAAVTGRDTLALDAELLKLALYTWGQERPIDVHDVELLTAYVPEASIFDLVDALTAGDGQRAMTLIHRTLDEDHRDPGFRLLASIVNHFRDLLQVRSYLDEGLPRAPKAMAEHLKLHPFRAGKLAEQSRAFSSDELVGVLGALQTLDGAVKTGRMTLPLAFDLLVADLAHVR
jgi:DNA polymerase III subunit delta